MKRIILKIALLVFVSIAFLCVFKFSNTVRANEDVVTQEGEEVAEINSFELFWPIVAGKTQGDSLYSLKTFKEKVRGWFIFGKPQKAEYAVFLATKRVIEAEKLINEGKKDLTNETLDRAIFQFEVAEENINAVQGSLGSAVNEINNKLDNLETFMPWLISQNEEYKDELQPILEIVEELHGKI